MTSIQCILCLAVGADSIEIFGKIGKSKNIAHILSKHFWFKIIQPTDNSQFICIECWTKTHNFHVFYQSVENANRESVLEDLKKGCDDDDEDEEIFVEHSPEHYEDVKPTGSFSETVTFSYCDLNAMPVEQNNKFIYSSDPTACIEPIEEIKCETLLKTFCRDDNVSDPIFNINNEAQAKQVVSKRPNLSIPPYFDMTCDQCNEIFTSLREIREHYRIVHNYANGYVKCCEKRLNKFSQIRDHIQWHQNPNCFTCDLCKKTFHSKVLIKGHMMYHEPEDSRRFKCGKCERKFPRKFLLNAHLRGDNCSGSEEAVCQHCQKKLKTQKSLHQHVNIFHPDASNRIREKFMCSICAKEFKTKNSFLYHEANYHKRSDEIEKVQCNLCNAWLKNPRSLRQHNERVHESSPKKCPYCDKIKANRCYLTRHIASVHAKPTHHCTLCDKSFTIAQALKDHIASHTGKSQYTCPYCQRAFVSKPNLWKHKKRIHLEQWTAERERKHYRPTVVDEGK